MFPQSEGVSQRHTRDITAIAGVTTEAHVWERVKQEVHCGHAIYTLGMTLKITPLVLVIQEYDQKFAGETLIKLFS